MGRPRKYESNAERQRAYRQRKRERLWGKIPGWEWVAEVDDPSVLGKVGNRVKPIKQAAWNAHVKHVQDGEPYLDDCLFCVK